MLAGVLRVRRCVLARIHLLIRKRVCVSVRVLAQLRRFFGVLLVARIRRANMQQRGVAVLRR
ncbi:hypothetical protein, partial [Xanthomonas vasicola]|uniref:hypothetical protein n=1 Tax=Xanthomonas vasicola TaxID=56459 RepID=UPI00161FC9B2